MSEIHEAINADANADPQRIFQQLTDPFRHELLVHCYRILGSIEDAEDSLQETLINAWRHFDTLREQSSLRAWLYKIATNVSLNALEHRKVRSFPTLVQPPADPVAPLPALDNEFAWLDPLPDFYLEQYAINPEQCVETQENVTLAFLAALQHLPGRQRAVLILSDVLEWSAAEISNALETSVAAVNSALQRARQTLKKLQQDHSISAAHNPNSPELSTLLTRYVQAWEAADLPQLMALLHEDAKLTMPPYPVWYQGRTAIRILLDRVLFANAQPNDLRLVATQANDCPAFAVFQRDASGSYQLAALHILSVQGDKIVQIDDYLGLDSALFAHFKLSLPPELG